MRLNRVMNRANDGILQSSKAICQVCSLRFNRLVSIEYTREIFFVLFRLFIKSLCSFGSQTVFRMHDVRYNYNRSED